MQFLSSLVILVLAFGAACSNWQVTRISGAEVKSAEPPQPKGAPLAASQSALPFCPQTHRPAQHASSAATTYHHKVALSWIAAPVAPRQGGDVAGYCIYRSTTQYAAKHDPLCSLCEQVNLAPVKGLSCIDDEVEDTAIYYYVVTTINQAGSISLPSNEATAPVRDQREFAPIGSPPPPSCRGDSRAVIATN